MQQVIGLIGGMSWESSAEYYRLINRAVRARLGGAHSARVLTMAATVTPVKGWRVQVRGVYHRIASVMPLAPGGVDLLFDVELEA